MVRPMTKLASSNKLSSPNDLPAIAHTSSYRKGRGCRSCPTVTRSGSMFDEFVQTSRTQPDAVAGYQKTPGFEQDGRSAPVDAFSSLTALETGFVSSDMPGEAQDKDAEQLPIFQLGRVQYSFSAPLALLCVSSNILTMCLYAYPSPARLAQGIGLSPPPRLVRIDLDDPEKTLEAEVPLPPAPRARNAPMPDPSLQGPHKMFSDPSGRHLILSTRAGDNYYWISGWKKARPLNKLKGLVIESVAWNQLAETQNHAEQSSRSASSRRITSGTSTPVMISTREILLGTQSGDIYETLLQTSSSSDADDGDFLDRLARRTTNTVGVGGGQDIEKYLTRVHRLQDKQPVTGLESEIFVTGKPSRAVVIATTSTRIYEFIGELPKSKTEGENEGSPLYEKLFAPYGNDAIPHLKSELPGDLPYSELHTWAPKGKRLAKALAWLTGPGIYHGLLKYGDQQIGDSVIETANLLPYPAVATETNDINRGDTIAEIPLSIALAEFHFILLYRDRIMAISSLDDQVVFQENLPLRPQERVIATAVDASRKTYWVYTDASIFEVVVSNEDRNVWRIHLDRGQHEQALKYAKTASQREIVLSYQGDQYFEDGRFIQAAQCYAQTVRRTFEEVTLRFIDKNERDALRYYLVMRLERLRRSDLTQRMMLATWLVEIYLSKINELEDIASAEEASQNVDNYRIELDLLVEELKQFLSTYQPSLDPRTTFGLIKSHGRAELILHYANIIGDHERLVQHWIRSSDWKRAISAIENQPSLELYYQFAPVLMRHCPQATVDSWIKQERLSPRRLMPALVQHRPAAGQPNEVIRYLQHVTRNGATDAILHNQLLRLLAASDDQGLHALISSTNVDPLTGQPLYDLNYALRVCNDRGKTEACVRIYAKMGNFESAVDLALKAGNIDLACTCADALQHQAAPVGSSLNNADLAESRAALRKKLWLRIARYVVEDKKDLSSAMQFLDRAPDLLSIEDILPFFPDFTVIDSFKDDICQALENYSQRIEGLKNEMDQATQSAEAIRLDTQKLANRFVCVDANDKCNICHENVLKRQFYVFACGHTFHAECLISESTRTLSPRVLRRILILQERLSRLTGGIVPALPPSYADAVGEESQVQRDKSAATKGAVPGLGAVGMLGLDKLRELISPDAIVGAISTSVSMGVAGGRRVLAPLDPFADPSASMKAQDPTAILGAGNGAPNGKSGTRTKIQGGRAQEEEEQIDALREELDSLVASACLLCDGSIQAINRPFVSNAAELEEWEL